MKRRGSLTVVGTGIRLIGQMTRDAISHIEKADKVLHLVTDSLMEERLRSLNPSAESLFDSYGEGKRRDESYREMVERILAPVREGLTVCAAFYGHPGVFVNPSHEAVRQAREEGFSARMLPGISAEDCLFADLGVDPGPVGCQSFEATDFLIRHRRFDPASCLVLWQIGCIGDATFRGEGYDLEPLLVLREALLGHYPPQHEVVIYQSAVYPICESVVDRVTLHDLPRSPVTAMSTLYVPPRRTRAPDPEMLERLGIRRR